MPKLAIYAGPTAKGQGMKDAEKRGRVFYGKTDRLPRFEIDDSRAFLTQPKDITSQAAIPLTRVFQHEDLFRAYPELKSLKIKVQDKAIDGDEDIAGLYEEKSNTVILRKPSDVAIGNDRDIMKRVLIHEIQHLIQDKEGFAYATPGSLFDYDRRFGEEEAYEIEERINLTPNEREKYPPSDYNYATDRRTTSPQTFFTTDQLEAAMRKELDRRVKEKEPLPPGYEDYMSSPSSIPRGRSTLGVIYPDTFDPKTGPEGQKQSAKKSVEKPESPKNWWERAKGDYQV